MVKWLLRKPNLLSGWFVLMIGSRRLSVSFSNTLEKKRRKLIGLYELGESSGFPGLNFQSREKYESLCMEF
jgi:hypothetical protein